MIEKMFIMVCCLLCSCMQPHTDDWPMFQHDPQHTGYSPSKMPEFLQVLWEFEGLDSFRTYLIISQKKVIAAFNFHSVLSLDITDGSFLWETREHAERFPTADEERIYIGSFGEIFCVDAVTGKHLWQHHEENVYFESPIVVDGNFITNCSVPAFIDGPLVPSDVHEKNKKVFCLDTETGNVVWEFYSKAGSTPPIYDESVYIHDGASIYSLNVETGDVIWEKESEIEGASHLSLSQDGKIFVASYGGVVSCLERDSGRLLWQYDCKSVITNALCVAYNRVFFGSGDGTFYCLDKKGELIWKREVGSGFCSPLAADKKVAVGAENVLYIMSAQSGEIIESYNVRDTITSIALSDGKLVVGTENGILCLGSSQHDPYLSIACLFIVVMITLVVYAKKDVIFQRKE